MSSYRLVFNPTGGPQQTDDEGRVLGAGEYGVAYAPSSTVKDAVDAGRLVEPEIGDDDLPAELAKVVDLADELERRHKAFAALPADDVQAIAGELELGPYPSKAELAHALAMHPSAQVPAKAGAPKEA